MTYDQRKTEIGFAIMKLWLAQASVERSTEDTVGRLMDAAAFIVRLAQDIEAQSTKESVAP